MKLLPATLFILFANFAFAERIIEITNKKGFVLHRITDLEEIEHVSRISQSPDSPYTPEPKHPDPFSLPEELVILVFRDDTATTGRAGIMFYESLVTYRENLKDKFPGPLGVNRKLTDYVIQLIEKGTLKPDSVLTPQLRMDNIREKSKTQTKPAEQDRA